MIAAIIALTLIISFPYVLTAIKRLLLILSIKRGCKRNGYKYQRLGACVFSSIKSGRCSFRVETGNAFYTVKLCGPVSPRVHLRFSDETHYAVRNLRFQLSSSARAITYETKSKETFQFRHGFTEKDYFKHQENVILLCPEPGIVSRVIGSETREIGNGDSTGEGILYNGDGFKRLLFKR
ncbi:MAG: hypothetical protein IJS45_11605 [Clostridia bacterium]|nr:hypothetical protein [Clostridia bacterium]